MVSEGLKELDHFCYSSASKKKKSPYTIMPRKSSKLRQV